jgi:hypothetical protein
MPVYLVEEGTVIFLKKIVHDPSPKDFDGPPRVLS